MGFFSSTYVSKANSLAKLFKIFSVIKLTHIQYSLPYALILKKEILTRAKHLSSLLNIC